MEPLHPALEVSQMLYGDSSLPPVFSEFQERSAALAVRVAVAANAAARMTGTVWITLLIMLSSLLFEKQYTKFFRSCIHPKNRSRGGIVERKVTMATILKNQK
jgi:hypothetical protein